MSVSKPFTPLEEMELRNLARTWDGGFDVPRLLATLDAERAKHREEYSELFARNRRAVDSWIDDQASLKECQRDWDALKAHFEAERAKVARLREALALARDCTEPFRNAPSMTLEELHDRLLVALADTAPKETPR